MNVDFSAAVNALIRSSSDVTDLVGTCVYSDHLPQTSAPPAVVYFVVSEVANDCIDGPLGFDEALVQIECYGKSRAEAEQIRNAVRPVVAGYSGTSAGVLIKAVAQASGRYFMTDRAEHGSDVWRYKAIQDFSFFYHSLEEVT